MTTIKEKLKNIIDDNPSNAVAHTEFRQNNPWLGEYSAEIARRILAIIRDDKELSQVKLAETLNVSKQYINRVIKGKENLSLETIYKLSKALNYELISFPDYKYTHVDYTKRKMEYISLGSFANTTEPWISFSAKVEDVVEAIDTITGGNYQVVRKNAAA